MNIVKYLERKSCWTCVGVAVSLNGDFSQNTNFFTVNLRTVFVLCLRCSMCTYKTNVIKALVANIFMFIK